MPCLSVAYIPPDADTPPQPCLSPMPPPPVDAGAAVEEDASVAPVDAGREAGARDGGVKEVKPRQPILKPKPSPEK